MTTPETEDNNDPMAERIRASKASAQRILIGLAVAGCMVGGNVLYRHLRHAGPTTAPSKIEQNKWKRVTAGNGSFSVEMPGNPKRETTQQSSVYGPVQIEMHGSKSKGIEYTLAVTTYPEKSPEAIGMGNQEFAASCRDSLLAQLKGVLVHDDKITICGQAARSMKINFNHSEVKRPCTLVQTAILVGNRGYLVQSTSLYEDADEAAKDIERFHKSIWIKRD